MPDHLSIRLCPFAELSLFSLIVAVAVVVVVFSQIQKQFGVMSDMLISQSYVSNNIQMVDIYPFL